MSEHDLSPISKTSPASRASKEKVKIRLLKMHIAYIEKRILDEFKEKCGVSDFNKWFEEQIYKDFYMDIKNDADIRTFTIMLRKRYYENIAEWIKEKVRMELQKATALEEVNNAKLNRDNIR